MRAAKARAGATGEWRKRTNEEPASSVDPLPPRRRVAFLADDRMRADAIAMHEMSSGKRSSIDFPQRESHRLTIGQVEKQMCIVESHVNYDAAHGHLLSGKHLNDRSSQVAPNKNADTQIAPGIVIEVERPLHMR